MLIVKVDFTAGTTIKEAAKEMIRLATQLDVCVEGRFNDVLVFAFAHFREEHIVKQYEDGIKQERKTA